MLRPRIGDFIYTPDEMSVIHSDIEHFSSLNVPEIKGFVCGILLPDASVDVERTGEVVRDVVQRRGMDCKCISYFLISSDGSDNGILLLLCHSLLPQSVRYGT